MGNRVWGMLIALFLGLILTTPATAQSNNSENSVTIYGMVITPTDPEVVLKEGVDYTVDTVTSNDNKGKYVRVRIEEPAPTVVISGKCKDMMLNIKVKGQVILRDLTITRTDAGFIPGYNIWSLYALKGNLVVEGQNRLDCQGTLNWNPLLVIDDAASVSGSGTLVVQNNSVTTSLNGGESTPLNKAACWRKGMPFESIPVEKMPGLYWEAGNSSEDATPFKVDDQNHNEFGMTTGPYLLLDFSNQLLLSDLQPLYQTKVGQDVTMDVSPLFSGGEGSRTYTAEGLPEGLTLTSQGELKGSFPQVEHRIINVTAKDTKGRTRTAALHWQINSVTGPKDVSQEGFVLDTASAKQAACYKAGEGTITWVPIFAPDGPLEKVTLTLENATISGGLNADMMKIDVAYPCKVEIVLKGQNKLFSNASNLNGLNSTSILTFTGNGTLDITCSGIPLNVPSEKVLFKLEEQGSVQLHSLSGGKAYTTESGSIMLFNETAMKAESFYLPKAPDSQGVNHHKEYHMPSCDVNGSHAIFKQNKGRMYTPIQNLRLGGSFHQTDGILSGGIDLLTQTVEGLSYNPETQELTLDNVRLTKPICADGSLTLRLVGDSAIFIEEKGVAAVDTNFKSDEEKYRRDVTIVGNGHLDVNVSDVGFNSCTVSSFGDVSIDFAFSAFPRTLGPECAMWYDQSGMDKSIELKNKKDFAAWGLTPDHTIEQKELAYYYLAPNQMKLSMADRTKVDINRQTTFILVKYDRQGRMICAQFAPIKQKYSNDVIINVDGSDSRAWSQKLILVHGDTWEPIFKNYVSIARPAQ